MINFEKMFQKQRKTNDPVFEKDGKWYFWDETWSMKYGPYNSEKEAVEKCKEYARRI